MSETIKPNLGKNEIIEVDGVQYRRLPIVTHLITDKDNICDVAEKYGKPVLSEPDDVLCVEILKIDFAPQGVMVTSKGSVKVPAARSVKGVLRLLAR